MKVDSEMYMTIQQDKELRQAHAQSHTSKKLAQNKECE